MSGSGGAGSREDGSGAAMRVVPIVMVGPVGGGAAAKSCSICSIKSISDDGNHGGARNREETDELGVQPDG